MKKGILKEVFKTKFVGFWDLEIPAGTPCVFLDSNKEWTLSGRQWVSPDAAALKHDLQYRFIFVPENLVKVVRLTRAEREQNFVNAYNLKTAPVLRNIRAAKLYKRFTGKHSPV